MFCGQDEIDFNFDTRDRDAAICYLCDCDNCHSQEEQYQIISTASQFAMTTRFGE
jgi:hypothetical protein